MAEERATHQSAVIHAFEGELAMPLVGQERRVLELACEDVQQVMLDETATAGLRIQEKLARLRCAEHLKQTK